MTRQKPTSEFLPPPIRRAKAIARIMDEAITIPVIGKQIGLDAVLGFIPAIGDVLTVTVSLYTLWLAYKYNLPWRTIGKMALNLLIDVLVGSVPVLGDIFDVWWKANAMNLELLIKGYQAQHRRSYQKDVVDVQVIPDSN